MKKRLLSMLCITALLLCLLPQTAFAAGSLEGVDYTRIDGSGSRVTLTLGELVFEGQLSRGSLMTDSEQDKIIRQTMNDLNITSGMLLNAKSMLDAAHKLEGFGMKDVENALLKLTGAQDAVELYKLVMRENVTSAQIAQKIAQDQIKGEAKDFVQNQLEDALTQGGTVALQGMGKYGFKLLFLLPDLTEIGVNALTKYENIKETCAAALERQLLLDTFYDECNKRIKDASGDRGAWEIRFDKNNTQTYNCTFWGISGVMMEASLSGVLEQVSEIDGAAGQYRGTLWLDIEGVDMSPVNSNFYNTASGEVFSLHKSLGFSVTSNTGEKTSLKRSVQGEISVMITSGEGTQQSDVSGSLTSGGDETEFAFNRVVVMTYKNMATTGETKTCTSTDIKTLFCSSTKIGSFHQYVSDFGEHSEQIEQDIGTVWKPLESTPYITVYY